MEDRSALFNQLKNFSQRKLKKVETKVVTASGEQLVEKRGAKGLQVLSGDKITSDQNVEPPKKLDLQVGLILPGFLLGSQDVAHDKSSLDSYGITHILNLDSEIENKFEDDYNYKNINILDRPDFDLNKIFDDCFDFIDDGRHYGNVLIHCSGTIGLSRSTTICVAYLMTKEKQKFNEAFNNVKEARSFVKPNEGFIKQLKDYEIKLRGAQQVKESGIDDPFALRKKQEIEQEKAMVAGAASVKNRMKMFGATLDTNNNNNNNNNNNSSQRSKSVSPMPMKTTTTTSQQSQQSPTSNNRWSTNRNEDKFSSTMQSKSMTPEPRKSWQTSTNTNVAPTQTPPPPPPPPPSLAGSSLPPPPPPPPMPTMSLLDDKSTKPFSSNNKSPSQIDSSKSSNKKSISKSSYNDNNESHNNLDRRESIDNKRMVFGRVPPPAMKIKGGLSIEKHDSTGDRNIGYNKTPKTTSSSLQLPLKRQTTTDSSGGDSQETNKYNEPNPRAPSPSAALRAAKQQVSAKQSGGEQTPNKGSRSPTSDQQHRPSVCGQLNRSSTKKLLNLIKTKTKSDLTLPDGDENDEIEALLGALENESIENIDWDELGLDEDEVKEIIEKGAANLSSSSSSSSSSSDNEETDEEEEEVEEEEVEKSTQHFVIRHTYR